MFKKPARKGNIRKKRKVEEPEEEDDAEATGDVLQGMRELQKMRSKAHGINPVTAEERERDRELKRQQKEAEAQSAAEQNQGGLLNSFFEKTSEKSAIDKQMDNYIERNMQILKGEDPDAEELKPKTAEDLLYQTPAELAPAGSLTRESELSGVSDIKEVELDIDTKLANIERTEVARVDAEEQRKKDKADANRPAVMTIPGNFNANFNEHKFDFQNRAVSSSYGGRGGGGGGRAGGGGGRGRGASDDNMVDRFKRSARGRGRGR